jgi:hypothetical protein
MTTAKKPNERASDHSSVQGPRHVAFDDARVGLVQEPFVAGADTILDRLTADIPSAEAGVTVIFSASAFPGGEEFEWRREESGGNWYYSPRYDMEGWLCPAMFKYFEEAPRRLWVQVKGREMADSPPVES